MCRASHSQSQNLMASKSTTWDQISKAWARVLLASVTLFLRFRESMGKYSYKGRKKAVERFTNWHGLGILLVISVIPGGLLLL